MMAYLNADFANSTQSRSWLFSQTSLAGCRQEAMSFSDEELRTGESKVRHFASGFHHRYLRSRNGGFGRNPRTNETFHSLCIEEQESLIRFHAHQIQTMVGPTALLLNLTTSQKVVSTAVVFFRRFYLSNSIIAICPRKMAVACAFFAAKVEEEKVEIGLLSHATALVHMRVQNSPLCRGELRAVSVTEIQDGELLLMEGLHYEFRCHHPDSILKHLTLDLAQTQCMSGKRKPYGYSRTSGGDLSPSGPTQQYINVTSEDPDLLYHQALIVWERALIFSDAPFLFAPAEIALAVLGIAAGCRGINDGNEREVLEQSITRCFSFKTERETNELSRNVNAAIMCIVETPEMDLKTSSCGANKVVTNRAEEMRRVLARAAEARDELRSRTCSASVSMRKRTRLELEFTPPRGLHPRKSAKVTPMCHSKSR